MSLRDWLFNKVRDDKMLIVEDDPFNPTKELVDELRARLSDAKAALASADEENEMLRREILTLKHKSELPPQPPKVTRFTSVSSARAELERRALELKKSSGSKN